MERHNWLLVTSLAGNGALLLLLILLLATRPIDAVIEGRVLIDPDFVGRAQGPLYFARAAPGSELSRIWPDNIYLIERGSTRAVFQFENGGGKPCTEITIHDRFGRQWVSVDLDDNAMIYEHYADDSKTGPDFSLRETDGDGIPDTMVNWEQKRGFEVDQKLTWRPMPRRQTDP